MIFDDIFNLDIIGSVVIHISDAILHRIRFIRLTIRPIVCARKIF